MICASPSACLPVRQGARRLMYQIIVMVSEANHLFIGSPSLRSG